MKKYLAVAVILLFMGLAVAPSINANINEEELVEITTIFSGVNDVQPHTVELTKDEAIKFDQIFDEINIKLKDAKSMEEAKSLFNNAIVDLNDLGLIPKSLGVEKAQELVTGELRICKIFENSLADLLELNKDDSSAETNRFCLIAGEATELFSVTYFFELPFRLIYLWTFWLSAFALENEMTALALRLYGRIEILGIILGLRLWSVPLPPSARIDLLIQRPFMFGGWINYGQYVYGFEGYAPSEGWVNTYGLYGYKNWTGPMFGNLFGPRNIPFVWMLGAVCYTGVSGFFGLMFEYKRNEFEFYPRKYMGYAIKVKLGPEPPIYFD